MPKRTCLHCGTELPVDAHGGRKYCSKKCVSAGAWQRRREQYLADARTATAEHLQSIARKCQGCGEEFTPKTRRDQKYCTQKCRRRATQARARGYQVPGECTIDGCDRPLRARGMCSMHWKRWARAEGLTKPEPWDDRRRDKYHRRRARLNGSGNGDRVMLAELIVRDNSTCQLCGKHIDLTLKYPHPMYRSIDHRIPLSRGGEHSLENTQLAHLRCNISKADKVLEEAS